LCFSKLVTNNKSSTAIHSYNLKNDKLTNEKVIFVSNKISSSGRHFGCRLAIKNKYIFATLGDRGARDDSQKSKNHSGAIIKILKNGNSYNNKAFKNSLPEIYSLGHRNPQGLSFDLTNNILWAHEHGPQGGDELNLIQSGKNYGWPVITYGVNYVIGTKIGEGTKKKGMEQPIFTWIPSIGTSGLTFISGNTFTKWDNNLLIGGLKNGHLIRVALKENRILEYEEIIQNRFGRIRDVRIGKDGNIYLLTDESNGKLIRLSLAN
jgi:glucose/arabinose dehydrogenase